MALIVQDYDASGSTISHACEVQIDEDQKNTSWAKKQQLVFLLAIS